MRFGIVLAMVCAAILPAAASSQTVPENLAQVQLSFAPVVRQAAPAVVNIYAQRIVAQRQSPSQMIRFRGFVPQFRAGHPARARFAGFRGHCV